MNKKSLLFVALGLGALYLFTKGKAVQPGVAPSSAAPAGQTGAAPSSSSSFPGWVDPAKKIASGALDLFAGAIAKEAQGIDGMVPGGGLQGHMASLGAYGELGGSFYGGV